MRVRSRVLLPPTHPLFFIRHFTKIQSDDVYDIWYELTGEGGQAVEPAVSLTAPPPTPAPLISDKSSILHFAASFRQGAKLIGPGNVASQSLVQDTFVSRHKSV